MKHLFTLGPEDDELINITLKWYINNIMINNFETLYENFALDRSKIGYSLHKSKSISSVNKKS